MGDFAGVMTKSVGGGGIVGILESPASIEKGKEEGKKIVSRR